MIKLTLPQKLQQAPARRPNLAIHMPARPRKPFVQACKFCGEGVNLDECGNTYPDGTAAHEECQDGQDWHEANGSDFD
jgi:hypothetical protein